ncbi:MAG: YifB family Mg chelatase-like AAA ATPase [Gallionella sp.]|nr:YifB family Mg chelatase-like AAA ATPase [Gallionella sp.]
MSLAVLYSRALEGMEADLVTVEVHLANGLPGFTIVGLPETEVKESRERVRAALQNCQFDFPARRITVNLAPADLPKESGRYDLPIALGILAASGQIPTDKLGLYEYAGELALTGEVRPVRGTLAMTCRAVTSGRAFILPEVNAAEAALVEHAVIYPAKTLLQVAAHLSGRELIEPYLNRPQTVTPHYPDFSEVKGQEQVKRALEIAAAGGHSVLMIGPPGTGKSMLAARFPGILPQMTDKEALESAALQSLGGNFDIAHWKMRPYRAPHHTASGVALVGGGSNPRPGEISMAMHGVLFLDELPEFERSVLKVLREPLESGHITISRAARHAEFPAQFQLIAAMNPCPCGYFGHYNGRCHCTPDQIARYRGKISGPLLDRIDIQIEVPAVPQHDLLKKTAGECSSDIQARVEAARQRQIDRQNKSNAQLSVTELDELCAPDAEGETLLKRAITRLDLSARAYHRILKMARTIADLAGSDILQTDHIAEAVQYRRMDKQI